MAPLPTLCWHSLIACRCACRNRTVAHVAKVLWPTSCLLRRHPCRCQASTRSAAPNGQGHRGSGWGRDPGAAACVLCLLHIRLAIFAFSRLTRKGKCSMPLCHNLVVWVHPSAAVPTSCTRSAAPGGRGCQGLEWGWDPGTKACVSRLPLLRRVSALRHCCRQAGVVALVAMASSPFHIAMVPWPVLQWRCRPPLLASSPSLQWRCRPCRTGVGSHVIALVVKALWPTLRRRHGSCCCRLPLHWPGRWPPTAFVMLVASIALALVASSPMTQWRHCPRCAGIIQFPITHSLRKAWTPCPPLAGCCTDIAAVAITSRLHRRRTAATALPLLQPSTPLQSLHRHITVAPSWL